MTPTKNKEDCGNSSNETGSPILNSSIQNFLQCKSVLFSTTARKLTNQALQESNNSVLNILDQLCSPIEEEYQLKTLNSEKDRKAIPTTFNLKQTLSKTVQSSSHCVKLKRNKTSLKTLNNNMNITNSDFFDDISDISLQILCDATNTIVDDAKPTEIKNVENESDTKVLISDRNRKLIYSNLNCDVDSPCSIQLNNLFSEVKILEEANKCLKKDGNPTSSRGNGNFKPIQDKKTDILNSLCQKKNIFRSSSNLDHISNVETENTFLNDSFGISNTQFCEAVEAAELMSYTDATLNVDINDTENKYLHNSKKENQESLKRINNNNKLKKALIHETSLVESVGKGFTTPINLKKTVVSLNSINNLSDSAHSQSDLLKNDLIRPNKKYETAKEMLPKVNESYEPDHILKGFQTTRRKQFRAYENPLVIGKQLHDKATCKEKFIPKYFEIDSVKSDKISDKLLREMKFPLPDLADNAHRFTNQSLIDTNNSSHEEPSCDVMLKGFQIPPKKYLKYMCEHNEFDKGENPLKGFCSKRDVKDNNEIRISLGKAQNKPATEQIQFASIGKAKQLFDNVSSKIKNGSQTASGKTVKVSKESLEKAMQLLDDGQSMNHKGFQTANGKSVEISEESVIKAKQLFADERCVGQQGFQTASGKSCNISEESLEKAKDLFDDSLGVQNGFQTASGKTVKISKESLEKAMVLLDDGQSMNHKGFQTANGKSVEISEESVKKAKQLFSDEQCVGGFQTASGKSFNISEESLEKAKDLFDNSLGIQNSFQTASGKTVKVSKESLEKAMVLLDDGQSMNHKGFLTASGKSVEISEESVKKAKQLFADEQCFGQQGFQTASGKSFNISKESLKKAKDLFENSLGVQNGFQTASGKTVKVSKESLEKAMQLLDDGQSMNHKGFQTANGKSVEISEESVIKAKQLFADERCVGQQGFQMASGKSCNTSEESLEKAKDLFDDSLGVQNGFQTASGKTVKISKESLEKAMVLLDDGQSMNHKGFQTANGKLVEISEESVKKAKQLFSDEQCVGGFQTASGKSFNISEESLEKAKDLFDNSLGIQNGFQTASGKTVKVSKESLEKDMVLLDDGQSMNHKGFLTASGKSVEISEESVKKAKKLFADEQCFGQQGFQTASGKSFNISKESLKKAKDLFENSLGVQNGFQTASGKTVKVSKESLEKAMVLLDDGQSMNHKGFLTASGKSVEISEESVKKAKQLFADEQCLGQQGFQTASGKSFIISKESLKKAKDLFENSLGVQNGFQTASGKTVKVSKESLEKAMVLLDDGQSMNHKGFLTASGKSVEISEESVKKAKQLFADEQCFGQQGFQTASGKSFNISEESVKKAKQLFADEQCFGQQGFQTASGKSFNISEESVKKAKQLFADEQCFGQQGFQTASGKSFNISEESLEKAKDLFDNSLGVQNGFQTASGKTVKVSEELLEKAMQLLDDGQSMNHKGFQTASGKWVEISKESVKKAKQLFADEQCVGQEGFQTANGKVVNTSEQSLQKARQLFAEELGVEQLGFHMTNEKSLIISEESLENAKHLLPNSSSRKPKSFQMASEKTVKVSKESLEKAMLLFENEQSMSHEDLQTASGKSLDMSEESVKKARKLFVNEQDVEGFQNATEKSVGIFEKSVDNVKKPQKVVMDQDQKKKRKNSSLSDSPFIKNNAINHSMLDKGTKVCNNLSRKRRKLFIESDGTEQSNVHNISYTNKEINSFAGASVISEADLSLLNNSKSSLSGNECHLNELCDPGTMSPSVAREITESMAALLADEASNSPFSLKPFVSSPGMLFDRDVRLPPIDCFENETHLNTKQLSPILDSRSFIKLNHQRVSNSTPHTLYNKAGNSCKNMSSFKPPYATSTPNESQLQSKRKSLFSNFHTQSKKRLKMSVDSKSETSCDVLKRRLEAALKQEKLIQEKLKYHEKIKPCKGSYLLRKQVEKTISLCKLAKNGSLSLFTTQQLNQYGVKKSVIELSLKNVMEFKFTAEEFFSKETAANNVSGIPVGDGALLILDEKGFAGVKEVTRAFLASPSIDPSLVSREWVENHFKWIVLKMAAMERMFPHRFGNRYLTPNNLMLQLKYRYDREIDRSERPALRKILEKDESSGKTVVLYVADILDAEIQRDDKKVVRKELVLSDGWYSVTSTVDYEMEMFVRSGKVRIGTKLVICGAELSNNENGCHPLETPANVRLRVASNSTRRARWFTRLGFYSGILRPMCLREVLSRGGSLVALTAVVARTYPVLFLEKVNGKTAIRSERAEQAAADEYQTKRQQSAEAILSQLQRDLDSSKRSKKQPVTRTAIKHATSTKHLYSLLDGVDDMSFLQDILSKEQLNEIQKLKEDETRKAQQQIQDKLVEQLDKKVAPRHVTRMLKVRLVDKQNLTDRSALLTVWNPSDDVVNCLSEGNLLTFYNILAAGVSRFGDLQLTAGKQTKFSLQKQNCCLREVTLLSELQHFELKPQFSEVDVVGLVVQAKGSSSDNTSRHVYFVDTNKNFLGISFLTDLKNTGYANTLTNGSLVAASNLHWRRHLVSWQLPSAYATEMSVFSQHPRQPHLVKALAQLQDQVQSMDLKTYIESCQDKIESLIARRNCCGVPALAEAVSTAQPSNCSSVGGNCCDVPQGSTATGLTGAVSMAQPNGCSSVGGNINLKPSVGRLDTSMTETLDTPTNRRLEILERYGEPPPISPLYTSTPTTVKRSFRLPMRNLSDER